MVEQPMTDIGTDIELIVYNYLVRHKINFEFQTSLAGGIYSLGGSVVDFILPEYRIGLRVMGEYWHRGVAKSGTDLIQKERLQAMGLTIVDLQEDDIKERLTETMVKALRGEEML